MKTYITKKKHLELKNRLALLQKSYREFAEGELAEAVDLGDARENSELDSAIWRQNHYAALIIEVRSVIESHIVYIEDLKLDFKTVTIGTEIILKKKDSEQREKYTILGSQESNVENGIISYLSPFAKMLIRKKVGDAVNIGQFIYEIEKISKAQI